MKKMTMICMSALLLLAVSCKKDNEKQPQMEGDGFTATIELQDDGSKTHLEGNAARWDNGDQISVSSNTYPDGYTFTSQNVESGNITAHFACADIPNDFFRPPFTAFYGNVTVSDGNYTLRVPAEQNAVYNNGAFQNTFERGANPMAARSNDKYLHFKNICGMLELKLYNTSGCHVDEIVLTAAEGVKLNGTGTVDMSSGTPVLGALDGGNTITLKCNGNLSTDANNPSHFYFVLPPVTLTGGFTITVKDGSKVDTRTVSSAIDIQRSHIKPMQTLAVAPAIATPEGAVKGGVFSVSPTQQVFFSMGNLTCNTNTTPATWSFYSNQTDYDHNGYTPNDGIISLFTWGCGTWSTTWNTTQSGSDFVDWGTKPITNGGNVANKWRTLSKTEMIYLLETRKIKGNSGYGNTCVNLWVKNEKNEYIQGLLVYNDGYTGTLYSHFDRIEAIPAGCAFFPATGFRRNNTNNFELIGTYANIWYSTKGYSLSFPASGEKFNTWNENPTNIGLCVRLVQDVP